MLWGSVYALIAAAAFAVHQGLLYQVEFKEINSLQFYENGNLFRLLLDAAGFVETAIMHIPFALGLGHWGAMVLFSLLWTLGVAACMWLMNRHGLRLSAVLVGLYLAVAPFFHRSLMEFLSHSYTPVFAALFFVLIADVAIRREAGVLRMAVLGLLIGGMTELYVSTVVLLPGAIVLWLWRRPRISASGWAALVALMPLCWIPDFISAGGSLSIVLHRPGLLHMAGGGPWQPISLREIVNTLGTQTCMAGVVLLVVNKLTKRSTLSPAAMTLFVFAVLQLAIPIAGYRFFSGTYVTLLYPAYAVPFALFPLVLTDTFTLIPFFRVNRKTAFVLACLPVCIAWLSCFWTTVPFTFQYYNRFRFQNTANLIDLSRHACELGLSSSAPSWQGKITGPTLSVRMNTWDYLKKYYAQPCDHRRADHILILFADDYVPQEGDRVREIDGLVFVGQEPLVEYRVKDRPEVTEVVGELLPGATYLGVTTNLSDWGDPDQSASITLTVEGQPVPVDQQSDNRRLRQYESEFFIFRLPDPELDRRFMLLLGNTMTTDTVYLTARRQPLRMYSSENIPAPHMPPPH